MGAVTEASASPARTLLTAVPAGGNAAYMDSSTPRSPGMQDRWGERSHWAGLL